MMERDRAVKVKHVSHCRKVSAKAASTLRRE